MHFMRTALSGAWIAMAQGYDWGGVAGRALQLVVVGKPGGLATIGLTEAPFVTLGFSTALVEPAGAPAVVADAMLWLAAPGDQEALEDTIAAARQPIVIAVPQGGIDDWSFAIGLAGVEIVPAPDHEGLVRAIGRAPARMGAVVHESAGDDPVQRLRELGAEVARIAQALDTLDDRSVVADRRPSYRSEPGGDQPVDAKAIRAMIRARRMRDQFFAGELFADPAWDILLDLMAARLEGREVGVSSLCIAAAVPPTTALRWISAMTEQGMLVRVADADDRRRIFIRLSADTAERMAACLAAIIRNAGPVA